MQCLPEWNEIGFSMPHLLAIFLMRLFTMSSEPILNSLSFPDLG